MAYHIVPYYDAEQVPIAKDPLDGFINSFLGETVFCIFQCDLRKIRKSAKRAN